MSLGFLRLWLYGAEECAEQLVALDKRKTTARSYLRRNVKQLIKQISAAAVDLLFYLHYENLFFTLIKIKIYY